MRALSFKQPLQISSHDPKFSSRHRIIFFEFRRFYVIYQAHMSERRSTLWFIFLRVDFLKPQKYECSNYQCLWTISFSYWFLFYIRVRHLPIKKLLHLIKTSSEHIFNIETGCRSCSLSRFATKCNIIMFQKVVVG